MSQPDTARPALSETRREILDRLVGLSEVTPEMRFGQLIENVCVLAASETGRGQWDVEDAELLDAVRVMDEQMRAAFPEPAASQSAAPRSAAA